MLVSWRYPSRRALIGALAAGSAAWPAWPACAQVLDNQFSLATPVPPRRIVALDAFFAEMLAAMGAPPVAMTMRDGAPPPHLAAFLGNVTSLGLHSAPDFEAVIGARPDLILGQRARFAAEASLLNAIASTLLLDEPAGGWRSFMLALSMPLELEGPAATAIAHYDDRAKALREKLADAADAETVLLMRVRQRDIRVYGMLRRGGLVLQRDLGLKPHHLTPPDRDNVTVSAEIIPRLDADRLFLMVEDERRMGTIEAGPLWQGLPAVKAGRVCRVDIAWWNQSVGPVSFGRVLDDVAAAFGIAA